MEKREQRRVEMQKRKKKAYSRLAVWTYFGTPQAADVGRMATTPTPCSCGICSYQDIRWQKPESRKQSRWREMADEQIEEWRKDAV